MLREVAASSPLRSLPAGWASAESNRTKREGRRCPDRAWECNATGRGAWSSPGIMLAIASKTEVRIGTDIVVFGRKPAGIALVDVGLTSAMRAVVGTQTGWVCAASTERLLGLGMVAAWVLDLLEPSSSWSGERRSSGWLPCLSLLAVRRPVRSRRRLDVAARRHRVQRMSRLCLGGSAWWLRRRFRSTVHRCWSDLDLCGRPRQRGWSGSRWRARDPRSWCGLRSTTSPSLVVVSMPCPGRLTVCSNSTPA